MEFQPLPAGPWIVRRWSIRMPMVQLQRAMTNVEPRPVLVAIHETGAQVTQVRDRGGDVLLEFETGMVVGNVSTRYGTEPLEGATVRLVGTQQEALTDADGEYRITGLDDGEYRITFRHPTLDSLGFDPEPEPVQVVQGQPAVVNFVAPNRWEILSNVCRDHDEPGTAALVGWVRELSTDETLPGATVTVTWTGYEVRQGSAANTGRRGGGNVGTVFVRGDQSGAQVTTDQDGRYLICGVPAGQTVDVQASWASVEGRSVRIRIPRDALAEHRDLTLRVGAAGDARPAPVRRTSSEEADAAAREIESQIRRRAGPRLRIEERTTPVLEFWFCVQGGRRQEADAVVSGCSGAVLLVDGAIAQEGLGQQGVAAVRLAELFEGRRIARVRVLTAREAEFELGQMGANGAVMVETRPEGL